MRVIVSTLMIAASSAMYDWLAGAGRARPPAECPHGCALWRNLTADGNTRDQADVNAKFRYGAPPEASNRSCAMPAYDPGEAGPGWCYCRASGDSSWGYCLDVRRPTQNLAQHLIKTFVFSPVAPRICA